MDLGAFSISLAVKDIHASATFYKALGFVEFGGDIEQNWLILKNGDHKIGLFQGMFEKNMLTFNPGWTQDAAQKEDFDDIRMIQQKLLDAGLTLDIQAEADSEGPAHIMLTDPDGNPVMLDQHV